MSDKMDPMADDKTNLGKITRVNLRKVWENEAYDFTNWLAKPENISLLSDEIGIEFQTIETEANVGKFSVDILAEEENTDRKIIIENQLEATDHDHLGKIITYASGYDAEIVIWVVRETREEHRAAIDWLNEHTTPDLNFFLIKIELWQIENSPLAPKFDIISKPNEWAKVVKQASRGELTETKELQLKFWEELAEYLNSSSEILNPQKPRPQHWTNISVGSSEAHIAFSFNSFDGVIRTEFYITDNKDLFHFLEDQRESIENTIGESLKWEELPEKKASRIKLEREGNVDTKEEWNEYCEWFKEKGERFKTVFGKYLEQYTKDS